MITATKLLENSKLIYRLLTCFNHLPSRNSYGLFLIPFIARAPDDHSSNLLPTKNIIKLVASLGAQRGCLKIIFSRLLFKLPCSSMMRTLKADTARNTGDVILLQKRDPMLRKGITKKTLHSIPSFIDSAFHGAFHICTYNR